MQNTATVSRFVHPNQYEAPKRSFLKVSIGVETQCIGVL